jgi:hypothetical protein
MGIFKVEEDFNDNGVTRVQSVVLPDGTRAFLCSMAAEGDEVWDDADLMLLAPSEASA